MKKTDIFIIGGGPGGIVAALSARKNYPDKEIALIRKTKISPIPCGIPYIFCRLDSVEKNTIPDTVLSDNKIELIIGDVLAIDREKKTTRFNPEKQEIQYQKLILAAGSTPKTIPIRGIDRKNVWTIKKDCEYLQKLREEMLKSKNIVIIGGGFIGMEIAEELSAKKENKISIVEIMESCLGVVFDPKFTKAAEDKLKNQGIDIFTKTAIEEIGGLEKAEFVKLKDGRSIPADIVIVSVGAKPDITLAQKADLKIGETKAVSVDKFMRTNDPDIFAVGDCAEKRDFLTHKPAPIMLASTACYEARLAAANLFKEQIENKGTVSIFSTSLGDLTLAAAGYNEILAKKENLDILIGKAESPGHHPGKLPNTQSINIKLTFDKTSRKIIGGQIMGPESVGEIINIVGLAIQKEMTIEDIKLMQVGTHPLLTSSPLAYPLIKAAGSAA